MEKIVPSQRKLILPSCCALCQRLIPRIKDRLHTHANFRETHRVPAGSSGNPVAST